MREDFDSMDEEERFGLPAVVLLLRDEVKTIYNHLVMTRTRDAGADLCIRGVPESRAA